jgi:hypothetical protein
MWHSDPWRDPAAAFGAISGHARDTLRAQLPRNPARRAKAPTGIEPVYTALQAAAYPLRHGAGGDLA